MDDAGPYCSVTNDNTQFGKALAVCPNAAVPAAQLFLMHHILRYSFAGNDLDFKPNWKLHLPWQTGFSGMKPGCDQATRAIPAAVGPAMYILFRRHHDQNAM